MGRFRNAAFWLILVGLAVAGFVLALVESRTAAPGGTSGAAAPPLTLTKGTKGPPASDPAGWKLVWDDEFDEPVCPDPGKWRFERGFVRNVEDQWYQPRNARCRRGVLDVEARRTSRPNPNFDPGSDDWRQSRSSIDYTSASLATKAHFTYGRFEMRARIDTRAGSWPAFWTLSPHGGWPRSGEIDIMEYYQETVHANVCRPRPRECGWSSVGLPLSRLGGEAWGRRFHVWRMDWSAKRIDLFVDGRLVNRFPLHRTIHGRPNPYVASPQRLLLSQAIGGINGGDPSATRFPVRFQVDWVRVYERR
jgi:beta-glucanase (GH16 family)